MATAGGNRFTLSKQDVIRLEKEKSPSVRVEIADKITREYCTGNFNEMEAEIARYIMRLLINDVEERVRMVMADNLKHHMDVPHDIIHALANDTGRVAVPVLRYSYVLTEDDLMDIVNSTDEMIKLIAIAMRESISPELSKSILDKGNPKISRVLVENRNASLSPEVIEEMIDNAVGNESVLEALVYRGGLDLTVAEKLVSVVSNYLQEKLVKTYRLPHRLSRNVAEKAREWTTLGIISSMSDEKEIHKLVNHLHNEKKLTPSMIINALCAGNVNFFEYALARLANIPLSNARILVRDKGPTAFYALYKAAKMPDDFADGVKKILEIALKETDNGFIYRTDYPNRVLEHLLSSDAAFEIDNMPYLMAILGSHVHHGHQVH